MGYQETKGSPWRRAPNPANPANSNDDELGELGELGLLWKEEE